MKRVAAILALVVAFAIPSALLAQESQQSLPVKLLILPNPGDPQVFMGDGKTHVVYELLLVNFTETTIKIDSLQLSALPDTPEAHSVVDKANSRQFKGKQLKEMFSSVAGRYLTPQDPVLKPAESGVIYLFLDDWNLTQWDNLLSISAQGSSGPPQNVIIDVRMRTSQSKPIVIGSPLRGKNWWTPNGPANDSIHRRTMIALGRHFGLPERFAVDWIQLGADGDSFSGNESDNKSYHAYDEDIVAVADGRIVSVKDGIPENTPQSAKMAVTITLDTLGGNNVVEDLGGSQFAFYAHLIPGTVAVKPGDQVKKGQLLGKLGNSGNSTEPHLHFQICDAANPLLCNGLPFEIDQFTRYDYNLQMNGEHPVKLDIGAPHLVTNEIFMNRDLADFSAAQ
ncbi:MAG: M23 family metallopeptidase [Candidatus Binataceae bacterium]